LDNRVTLLLRAARHAGGRVAVRQGRGERGVGAVPAVLRALAARGLRIGLISNSHRCLGSFQSHFELGGLIDATISSPDHGFMKPHPSIFSEALQRLDVQPSDAVMVGDSIRDDVEGALGAGMRAALVHRSGSPHPRAAELAARGVPVIRSLRELTNLVIG
jgi:putative hydrolase of the HAD superfamily